MSKLTEYDFLIATLAQADHHGITLSEVLTMAMQCRSTQQLDALVDAYTEHVPVMEMFIEAEPIPGEKADWVGFMQYAADMQDKI